MLVSMCVLLAFSSVIQFRAARKFPAAGIPLEIRIPKAISGWAIRDVPLAESPEVQKTTRVILGYDDVVFREYSHGDLVVQVYVSAWLNGKMDARDIAIHNPDNCWTANGYTRIEGVSKVFAKLAGLQIADGQFRRFEARGSRLEVAYWLLVDGKSFATVDESSPIKAMSTRFTAFCRTLWFDLIARGTNRPIYFIRLSSSHHLEAALSESSLQPLIIALLPLLRGTDLPP